MRRKLQQVALALLLCPWNALADSYPIAKGWVNDFAQVLDQRAETALNQVLSELNQKADAEVAVVVVNSLNGQDVGGYATGLYQAWGMGKKGRDRGALILVSAQDRKARIEVGYGLEGILPDGLCGQILDEQMIPFFKEGNYPEGILRSALALAQVVAQDAGVELSAPKAQPVGRMARGSPFGKLLWLALLLFLAPVFFRNPFLFLFLMGGMRPGSGFGGRGFGGGFGGFGGGLSGGGGSSRSW